MVIDPRLRRWLAAHHVMFVALLVALAALVAWLAHEYRAEYDLTRAHRNTVSDATLAAIRRIEGPVAVTAYAITTDARGVNLHRRIAQFFQPYQRAKKDLTLAFVDPREQPKRPLPRAYAAPPNW